MLKLLDKCPALDAVEKGKKFLGFNPMEPPNPGRIAQEAYQKYFPQYMNEAIEPEEIGKYAVYLCSEKAKGVTGKVFVMKKGKEPYGGYHT